MTQTIEQLQAKIAEIEAEVERLKRTNSSYANLTKAQESQLTNLRQRLYQLKGADSAIDSERQANCDLTEQLAAEQLNNKLLREALTTCVCAMQDYQAGIGITEMFDKGERLGRKALAIPASIETLDAYVAEKVKEESDECTELNDRLAKLLSETAVSLKGEEAALTRHSWHDLPVIALAKMVEISELTKQRDLAVEALKEMLEYAGIIEERCDSIATDKARAAIKESEGK